MCHSDISIHKYTCLHQWVKCGFVLVKDKLLDVKLELWSVYLKDLLVDTIMNVFVNILPTLFHSKLLRTTQQHLYTSIQCYGVNMLGFYCFLNLTNLLQTITTQKEKLSHKPPQLNGTTCFLEGLICIGRESPSLVTIWRLICWHKQSCGQHLDHFNQKTKTVCLHQAVLFVFLNMHAATLAPPLLLFTVQTNLFVI